MHVCSRFLGASAREQLAPFWSGGLIPSPVALSALPFSPEHDVFLPLHRIKEMSLYWKSFQASEHGSLSAQVLSSFQRSAYPSRCLNLLVVSCAQAGGGLTSSRHILLIFSPHHSGDGRRQSVSGLCRGMGILSFRYSPLPSLYKEIASV